MPVSGCWGNHSLSREIPKDVRTWLAAEKKQEQRSGMCSRSSARTKNAIVYTEQSSKEDDVILVADNG